MQESPHRPAAPSPDQQKPKPPPSPPDFRLHGVTREQFAAWRSHPVTKAWRKYLADMAEDRKGAALDAVMSATLTERDQVRMAADIAMLTHMADPDFDTAGEFYGRARMSQDDWDAAVAASEESGVEIHDPYAEEDEDDD